MEWVVAEAAAALGVAPNPVPVADAGREVGLDAGWSALERIAEAAGLRLLRWTAPVDEAIAIASPRCPVVARAADGGWILVLQPSGRGARIRRDEDDLRVEVVTVDQLAALLGGTPEAPLAWGLLECATPFDALAQADDAHLSPWSRVRRLLRAERHDVGIVVIYAATIGLLSLAVPVAVQMLVNTVLFGAMVAPLLWISLLALGGLVFAAALQLAQLWVVEVLQRRVFVNLVAELSWRLPRLRLEALDRTHGPKLVNRFFDVIAVQKSISTLLLDGVAVVIAGVTGTLLLAVYHPYLLVYAVLLWTALAAALWATGRRGPATAIAESYAKHDVADWIEDLAANPQAFKHGGGQGWAWTRADALAHAWLDARHAHFRVWFAQVAALLLLYAAASTLLLALGGALVIAGQLTIGQLMAAELVVVAVLGSFTKMGKQLEKLYDLLAALDKIGHLLEVPLERADGEVLAARTGPMAVEARGLTYRYEDERPVLEDLSLDVRPGERVALVASGGSGKRTLLDLLVGARAPTAAGSGWTAPTCATCGSRPCAATWPWCAGSSSWRARSRRTCTSGGPG